MINGGADSWFECNRRDARRTNRWDDRHDRAARQRDCLAIDGLGMLLHQGILSFEIWTGKKAPRAAMQAALEQSAGRKI
jgi:shikimate dehydrogenase